MADDDRRTDHTDDPRKQESGTGGYPETTPAGTEGERDDQPGGDPQATDAPSPSSEKEGDRQHATGNPDAAG
jgi:hypothetical protein